MNKKNKKVPPQEDDDTHRLYFNDQTEARRNAFNAVYGKLDITKYLSEEEIEVEENFMNEAQTQYTEVYIPQNPNVIPRDPTHSVTKAIAESEASIAKINTPSKVSTKTIQGNLVRQTAQSAVATLFSDDEIER